VTTNLSPAETALYERFDAARRDAGNPGGRAIGRLIREVLGPTADVSEEKIRYWIKHKCLPRRGEKGDKDFLAVIQVLQAEKELDWLGLLHVAQDGRDERLGEQHQLTQPDAEGPSTGNPAGVPNVPEPAAGSIEPDDENPELEMAHRAGDDSPPREPPGPVVGQPQCLRRYRRPIVIALSTIALLGGGAWFVDWLRGPQPQCATVIATPSAPVWLEIDHKPIKFKRYGAQVRLYPALGTTHSPQGTYQAVLLREDGRFDYGWMLQGHLQSAECNP
jgi:hypothetical protein